MVYSDTWADTTTAHGRLILTVLGGLAEFERELIRPPSRAEHAFIDGFELVAFDLPGYKDDPRVIGWELFGGADFLTMVTKGTCATFEEAKVAAEAELAKLQKRQGCGKILS